MTIFVLGMHRSGTSVATNLLQLMGAYIGQEQELLPPSPDNPRGFFERKDALAINQLIYRHHRSNWYDVAQYDLPTSPLPADITLRIEQLTGHLSQQPVWALKDPRLCYTLPYWLEWVPNPTIITVSRHPAEIAQSLMLRNDMPYEQGLMLWQRYIEHALQAIKGLQVVTCDYDDLLQNPVNISQKLLAALQPHHPTLHVASADALGHFIDPALKRATHQTPLSPAHQALFEAWRS